VDALVRRCTWLALLCAGCASTPPAPTSHGDAEASAPDVLWGDEYAGVIEDTDLEDAYETNRTSASFDVLAEPANEWLRSLAASARYSRAAARYRQGSTGRTGAVELFDMGPLRHVVAGAIRPTIGEGALVADARELGSPTVRATPSASMMRVASSSSLWGSVLGAGAEVDVGAARLAAAAWRPHDDDSTMTAWSACEWRVSRTRVGLAYGQTTRRPSGAVSVLVAHAFRSSFVALELIPTKPRACAARVVAGNTWRAAFALGAAAASDVPIGAQQRERRLAVIERRDSWRGLTSRVTASSLARRSGEKGERRRRMDWTLRARVDEGARVEGGVRFTETEISVAPSPLDFETGDYTTEWRGRVALVVREQPTSAMEVEHMFRIDAIREGASTGLSATWRGSLRRAWWDIRAQASAWGLGPGQLGYLGRGGLPGSGAFTTVSRSGTDLTIAVRADVRRWAALGAEWRRNASDDTQFLLGASLGW
jgi:hypothetical protein